MDGFEVIYSKYSPLVFRYLLSLGVDFLSAEELTAETFYRAYTNFDKYKGESKIETWLCAIAKNEYRKDCKRREKATATEEIDRAADQTDLVDRLLDRDQAISIYKTVHSMAEPYKEVFLLRVLGELSFKESIGGLFCISYSVGAGHTPTIRSCTPLPPPAPRPSAPAAPPP